MPAARVSMRKIKEVLRLRSTAQLSHRQIGIAAGISSSTVREYLSRATVAEISWPLPEHLDDAALEELLFPETAPASIERPPPDFQRIHVELRRKGVTLLLLWQEYKATYPDGYNYSRFCDLYRQWRGTIDLVMRQTHRAGERLFVDYAGVVIPLVDPITGEQTTAQIFVAALGASNYTYVEATHTQTISDWLASHVRAFAFFGGVPAIVVPDNLKSGVTSPHRYDPEINRSYAELAEHYGVAVIPARSAKPRDKAKVESAVQMVEQSILAVLRDRTFFSLAELNAAIVPLRDDLNNRPLQKLPGSRHSAFIEIDRPMLKALPERPYSFSQWKKARVNIDYHVDVQGHYYSVPYKYVGRQIDVRIGPGTVECFVGSRVIATHLLDHRRGQHTTIAEHMPASHRAYAEWTPERIIDWAARIGPMTAELARAIIASRAHPEQGYRACLGILRLAKVYGNPRLEAASKRALAIGARSYKSIESILKHGLDQQVLPGDTPQDQPRQKHHENIRGAHYYAQPTESTNA